MAGDETAIPRFAFSRRDPGPILTQVEKCRAETGRVSVLALGGQPRDRVYCAQLLAELAGETFVQADLALSGAALADEQAKLEQVFALARSTPSTLFIDGAETLFAHGAGSQRAKAPGDYLRRALPTTPGGVVLGMPEKVEPDPGRLPSIDIEVTFRAPGGAVIAGRPLLLPSQVVDEQLLPAHNFHVFIDGVDVGMCAVSAPSLVAGPLTDEDFDPTQGVGAFVTLSAEQRATWPTLTLRRALTQSKLFYEWKQSQFAGKPLLRDVEIRQMDWPNARVVNTWLLRDCWAKSWQGPAFDAMQAAVAEEILELYYSAVAWR